MKKKKLSLLSGFLAAVMLLGALTACKAPVGTTDESETTDLIGSSETESAISTETESQVPSESETEKGSVTEEDTTPKIEGEDAALIEYADRVANKVQSSYTDDSRGEYVISNNDMNLNYSMFAEESQQVKSLTNKAGKTYVENTMDVFVKMKNGKTYHASQSVSNASANIFRMGYYYYENRISKQVFVGADGIDSGAYEIEVNRVGSTNGIKVLSKTKERTEFEITSSSDPWFSFSKVKFEASDYKYLQITMKANAGVASNPQVFIIAGSAGNYTAAQSLDFSISADGNYHTYTIPIKDVADYTGTVRGLRLDINGSAGATFEISSVKAISMGEGSPDALSLNRSFLTYSDKLHQIIQVVANTTTTDIAEIGMSTTIAADTVAKLVVKDKNGTHDSLEGVDWDSAEYVGFDIKGAGIFGYILPYDGRGGKISVALADGVYTVLQTAVPENNTINPSVVGTNNANDFYMGQRIYTDTKHDFEKFIHEAECERHPLTEKNFEIDTRTYSGAKYIGYDSLYGYYKLSVLAAGGFNGPYFEYPNKHFGVQFKVTGDELDRKLYLCAYTSTGSLECAALLNADQMLLPVPIEVAKNFKGDGEDNIYMLDDATYGEAYLPLLVDAKEEKEYTVLHLYQNWGNFPLKQISSIQYTSPYYHLSAGVTETNCVVVYGGNGLSLPDFRGMSAPLWKGQPQHNSSGSHSITQFTNADGEKISIQIENVEIDSYGPTYADMNVNFMSDDGNLRVNYQHAELPQTDENRTFFTLTIDVLGDVSIANFKNDFYFYRVTPNDPTGLYQKVGYLDQNNKSQVVAAADVKGEGKEYILGNEYPYFSFFDMSNYSAQFNEGYGNVAMIIKNASFTIGGESCTAPFVIRNEQKTIALSLNLGEVNLKAGDSLVIEGILLPWGSQESEYKDGDGTAPDQNVRNVRLDSVVNPMKATPVSDCEAVESAFIPKLRTTNGKSAEFKVSGGNNNVAVRVYGFEMLTVPTILELVDGKWVEYKIASINKLDQDGNGYKYDGYTVNYDGDGTYSYSFTFDAKGGAERTFKIVADTAFEGWGEEQDPIIASLPLNFYADVNNATDIRANFGDAEIVTEGENSFFRYTANGTDNTISITPFKVSALFETTGQYAVIKYRIPKENKLVVNCFDLFMSTEGTAPNGRGDYIRTQGVIADGEWHVIVVDASHLMKYTASSKGTYLAQYLRIDLFIKTKNAVPESDYIDLAYVGISDSIEDICKLNEGMETLTLFQGGAVKSIDTKTGKISGESVEINALPETTDLFNVYLSGELLATKSMGMGGCSLELSAAKDYVRYYGAGSAEAYFNVYVNASGSKVTGQYLVYKYRVPTDIPYTLTQIEIFAGTSGNQATGSGDRLQTGGYLQNGEWQLMIVDLSKLDAFKQSGDTYSAHYLRIDILNNKIYADGYVDVAYIACTDSIDKALEFDAGVEYYTLVEGSEYQRLDRNGDTYTVERAE